MCQEPSCPPTYGPYQAKVPHCYFIIKEPSPRLMQPPLALISKDWPLFLPPVAATLLEGPEVFVGATATTTAVCGAICTCSLNIVQQRSSWGPLLCV